MNCRIIALCVISLLCSGCSLMRASCDSPGVLADVRQMLAGLNDAPSNEERDWLENNLGIMVVSQGADSSGNQVKCEANVTISDNLFKQSKSIIGLMDAIVRATGKGLNTGTLHYNINFKPYSIFPLSTALAPASEQEAAQVRLFQTVLQYSINGSRAATQPVPSETAVRAEPAVRDQSSSIEGVYRRTQPASGEIVVTKEPGGVLRIALTAASPETDPMKAAGDCYLQGVGTINGGRIAARPVPFKTDSGGGIDVSADDTKDLGPIDITVGDGFLTVNAADFGSICGVHSDLTGTYSKTTKKN